MPTKPAKKKKIHEHVKDTVVNWDERMKKYRFYKEIIKDFLLMIPLLGSVGTTVLNKMYKAYTAYTAKAKEAMIYSEAPAAAEEAAAPPPPPTARARRMEESAEGGGGIASAPSGSGETMAEVRTAPTDYAPAAPEYNFGDFVGFFFIFWLLLILAWRAFKRVKNSWSKK